MTFPVNYVVLSCLAETDLFAVLALADSSSTLRRFIYEHVLTISLLRRFLQEYQYVLHHNARYFQLVPHTHVAWLYRAFETLRQRDTETAKRLEEETAGVLYPLLGLLPFKSFKNTTGTLLDDFSIPEHNWKGQRVKGNYTPDEADLDYDIRLGTSWLHQPRWLLAHGDTGRGFYDFHEKYAQAYLREDFLLCKRYVDDFNTCYRLLRSEGRYQHPRNRPTMLAKVAKLMGAFPATNLNFLVQKRCIQSGVDYWYLSPNRARNRTTSASEFKSLLESQGWLKMWDQSELGWWYSLGLWQYGPDCVESFIDRSFKCKREALLWLFLGAHRRFRPKAGRWKEAEYRHLHSCCPSVDYNGCERDYLVKLIATLSEKDRIWAVRQIIRKAPEYGVCRSLAINVFSYFMLHDLKAVDNMMCVLLEEIIGSPLQYLFEYAISIAILEYQNTEEVAPLRLDKACKFSPKLLRKDLDLYAVLRNVETESLERRLFQCSME